MGWDAVSGQYDWMIAEKMGAKRERERIVARLREWSESQARDSNELTAKGLATDSALRAYACGLLSGIAAQLESEPSE